MTSAQTATSRKITGGRELLWILCLAPLLILRLSFLLSPEPLFDYISYWASGHLFLTGSHPYLEPAVVAVQHAQGWTRSDEMMTFCPPWSLPFLGIMALLPFRPSQIAWFAASLLLNSLSSLGLWHYCGGAMRRAWIPLLLAATFLPMGAAELHGQITPLMLASLTGFLLLLRANRQFAAGALLLGLGFKPHLLYLVLLAIVLWTLSRHAWRLLAGAALSYSVAVAAAALYNRNSLDYLGHTVNLAMSVSCGVGGVLRAIFGVQHLWLQFLPCAVGLAWFLASWRKHASTWDWRRHLPLLLLVSVSTSPYCWYHDFILILPALVSLAAQNRMRPLRTPLAYLCVSLLIFESFRISEAWRSAAGLLWIVFYCIANNSAPDAGHPYLRQQEATP